MLAAALGALFLLHFGFVAEGAKHEWPLANIVAIGGDEHRTPHAEGSFIECVISKATINHVQLVFASYGVQDSAGRDYGAGRCIVASSRVTIANGDINSEGEIAWIDSNLPDLILLGSAVTLGIELCLVLPEWQSEYVSLCRVAQQRQSYCTDHIEAGCRLAPKIAIHESGLQRLVSAIRIDEGDADRPHHRLPLLFQDVELSASSGRLTMNIRVDLAHFINLLDYRTTSNGEGEQREPEDAEGQIISKAFSAVLAFLLGAIAAALIKYGVDQSREIGG